MANPVKKTTRLTEFKITLSKTVQVQQYEPLTITLTETHEIEDEITSKEKVRLTDKLTAVLERSMENGLDRYRQ